MRPQAQREARLPHAADPSQGHEPVGDKQALQFGTFVLAPDEVGQRLGRVRHIGGRRRSLGRVGRNGLRRSTLDRAGEHVAVARNGADEALGFGRGIATVPQQAAERGDLDGQIAGFDDPPTPDLPGELVLGDGLAGAADEHQQQGEGALADLHQPAVPPQLAPLDGEFVGAEPHRAVSLRRRGLAGPIRVAGQWHYQGATSRPKR